MRVLFVDYGNEEEMSAANVVEVPQSLCEFKPFARKVILHLTKIKKFNDEKVRILHINILKEIAPKNRLAINICV